MRKRHFITIICLYFVLLFATTSHATVQDWMKKAVPISLGESMYMGDLSNSEDFSRYAEYFVFNVPFKMNITAHILCDTGYTYDLTFFDSNVRQAGYLSGSDGRWAYNAFNGTSEVSFTVVLNKGVYYLRISKYFLKKGNTYTISIEPSLGGIPSVSQIRRKTAKKVYIKWNKVVGISGYEIYRSTSKKSGYKLITVAKPGKTSLLDKKGLKRNKRFYYRIRAYKQVGTTRYYSAWSKVVSVKL